MKRWLILIIILVLVGGNVYFNRQYRQLKNETASLSGPSEQTKTNRQLIDFTLLFIDKVLRAEQEVDFETRLQLENKVRELKNEKVLSAWQAFVESQTETEAQDKVKNLLESLVKNIH